MQAIDPSVVSLIQVIVFFFIWLVAWTNPPKWISDSMKQLREWAPRMVASLRWGNATDVTAQAAKQDGIVGNLAALAQLAPLIQYLPQILQFVGQMGGAPGDLGNADGSKKEESAW